MSVASVLTTVGGSLLGKALGGGGGSTQQTTQQQQMDPAMRELLFGSGVNNPGIFGHAKSLYDKNPGGMNPAMETGINMQRQALMNPQYAQTFQNMRDSGNNLMGQGVSGNPFTQQRGLSGAFGGMLGSSMGMPAQRQPGRFGRFAPEAAPQAQPQQLSQQGARMLGNVHDPAMFMGGQLGSGQPSGGLAPELMVNGGMPRQAAPTPTPAPQTQSEQIPPELLEWWKSRGKEQADSYFANLNAGS